MNSNKTPGYWIGYVLGAVILACLACCVGGVAIALTLKFLTWIF